ncbi:MAG: MraY family glycosyltransferase, partial [Verrucomicrobiota bacterium]|nr:MraY family glycosyltransferase [Verrucomicrobiota bacterium]
VNLGIFGSVITIFWIVSMMNIINLIDGLDGLAGGIGLMLMVLLAYLAFESNIVISYILALGMVGAITGFLFHNFPPAKAYLGDSGAYLIGFVIASLSLLNSEKGAVLAALIAPMLALALPIADVAYAIIRRAIRGLPLFRPDQEHIHHKFLQAGHSRQRTVLFLYAISLLALVGGLLAFAYKGRYLPLFMGFTSLILLYVLRSHKISLLGMRNELNETLRVRQDARTAIYLRDWFLLDSERADSGSNLWEDYCFILKKMGICRAELSIGEIRRTFSISDSLFCDTEKMWHSEHSIGEQVNLHVYADREKFTENHFALIADISSEAWSNAALRWNEVNDCSLDFESEARETSNQQLQKSRSLYKPTYS